MSKDTEPHNDGDESVHSETPGLLYTWERIIASILGAGGVFFGGLAVFTSSNQAGSAVLLLISAAFLLIGLQGTPLTKFTSGSNSVELDRRRIRQRLIKKAIAETDPEAARAYEVAAAIVAPGMKRSPAFNAGMLYEFEISKALKRIGVSILTKPTEDMLIDFIVAQSGAQTAIALKYRMHTIGMAEVNRAMSLLAPFDLPVLLVTNAPLSREVEEFNANWADRHPRAEVVTWRNEADDQVLLRALVRTKET